MDFFSVRDSFVTTCRAVGIPDREGRSKPLAEKTIRGHLEAVDAFFGRFGHPIEGWNVHQVRSFLANRRWGPNTKRSRWKGLDAFARFLVADGHLRRSFLDGVPCPPAGPTRKAPHYDEDDRRILLECCRDWSWVGKRDAALIETAWWTPFRKSEFAAMGRADVDFRNYWIQTPISKNGDAYGTVLPPPAAEAIKEYLGACPFKESPALWLTEDGRQLTADGLTKIMQRLHKRAMAKGFLKPLYFHALRHRFGRNAVRWGLSTREIADRMGHRSDKSARTYVADVTNEEGAKKLRQVFGLSGPPTPTPYRRRRDHAGDDGYRLHDAAAG